MCGAAQAKQGQAEVFGTELSLGERLVLKGQKLAVRFLLVHSLGVCPPSHPNSVSALFSGQAAPVQALSPQVCFLHPRSSGLPCAGLGATRHRDALPGVVASTRSSCTQVYTWHGVVLELTADAEGLEDVTDVVYACCPQPAPEADRAAPARRKGRPAWRSSCLSRRAYVCV
jgi:hypothetical protein